MVQWLIKHKDELSSAASLALSLSERLRTMKATTGPVRFTNNLVEYMCYSNPRKLRTPAKFYNGGEAPGLHIFGIATAHLTPPDLTDPDVFVRHL